MRRSCMVIFGITIWMASAMLPCTVLAQNGDVSSSSSDSSEASKNPPPETSSSSTHEEPSSSQESSAEPPPSSAASSEARSSLASSSSSGISSSTAASQSSIISSAQSSSAPLRSQSSVSTAATVRSSLSSSQSSAESSVTGIPTPEPSEDKGFWDRENFGYNVPVIDPAVIARPLSFVPESMGGNALLALLMTLIIGFGGAVLHYLTQKNEKIVNLTLRRLPLQAILTILLIELYAWFMPTASAQGFSEASALGLFQFPLFALLFLLVIGASNGLLNALAAAEGKTVKTKLTALPGIASINTFLHRKDVSRALWFVLLLLLLYGIVGSHINPQFSLFPSENLGIILVAVVTVTLAAYTPDVLRYLVARHWKSQAWFEGNITGLLVALLCVYLSRKFQLSPGYIYGLPVGLFLLLRARQSEGLLQFLSLTWMLLIAAALWLLLPILSPYEVLHDTGNLLFIVLLEGVFFELLPLPSIAGGTIFNWKRWVWAALFFVVVFLLFQTIFHPQGTVASLQQSPSAMFTLVSVGCYAVGIVLLWGYVLWARKKK